MTHRQLRLAPGIALVATLAVAGCSGSQTSPPALPQNSFQSSQSTIAGTLGRPIPDAKKPVVYVADAYSNTVWIFPASGLNPSPIGSITQGVSGPQGVAVDKNGTLYVANTSSNSVTIYPAGKSSPSLTLSQGLTTPAAVAVDPKGNVWVSNELGGSTGSVVEFRAGKTSPSKTLSGLNPYGIAFDSKGNLYLENTSSTQAYVAVYPPGASKPTKTFGGTDLIEPLGITVGPTGDVYVADYQQDDVFIYGHGTYKLVRKFFVQQGSLAGMTIASNKRLYIADASNTEIVSEARNYGFGPVLPNRYHNGLLSAFGVAADPIVPAGP